MRVGINDSVTFLEFLDELEYQLRDQNLGRDENGKMKWAEYKKKLVFIMDNASIHCNTLVQDFFFR